jgi:hypothetical protein
MSLPDQFSLHGRVALVTGATRGIGKSMAIALAEAGSDIVLIQRDDSNTATRDEIRALGRSATIYTADLAHRDQIKGLVKNVLADGHDISVLINCGGIQRRHPADQFPDEDWDEVRIPVKHAPVPQRFMADVLFEGDASESRCGLCSGTRHRRIHADKIAGRGVASQGLDHQRRIASVVPRRPKCASLCGGQRWCCSTDQVAVEPVGESRDQCQRRMLLCCISLRASVADMNDRSLQDTSTPI